MSPHTTVASRGRTRLLAIATLVLLGAADVRAQEERPDRRPGALRGPSPEMIMSLRDRLELTDDQLDALEERRAEWVAERNARRAEMEEMRSRLRAGEIDRDEIRTWMQDRRSGAAEEAEGRRARLEAILDEDQLRTLNDIRVRRAEMRGRRGAMRGGRGGMRGGRGATRGDRPGARRGGRDRGPREAARGVRGFRGGGPGMAGPRGFRGGGPAFGGPRGFREGRGTFRGPRWGRFSGSP